MDAIRRLFETQSETEEHHVKETVVEVEPIGWTDGAPTVVTPTDLAKTAKTSHVLVDPAVLMGFIGTAARHRQNEIGALLIGHTEGKFLCITRSEPLSEIGTSTRVAFPATEFDRIHDLLDDNEAILGWAHSHPGYGVFMSGTDVTTQRYGEQFSPEYVALVVDPFSESGIEFGFFRLEDGTAKQLPYAYLGRDDGTR